jgi:hypothetical protein
MYKVVRRHKQTQVFNRTINEIQIKVDKQKQKFPLNSQNSLRTNQTCLLLDLKTDIYII